MIVYSILITGGTYAYLTFEVSNNSLSGMGKCNIVNYREDDISEADLLSTTNYEEGASTTITLSQSAGCSIYTTVGIYLHTNDTTTAPIETVPAFKYKIITEDDYEYNGTVTAKGDYLLVTVPLTSTEKTYTIYFWIDSNVSLGAYHNVSYSGYIYASSEQTSTIGEKTTDTIAPTLFLTKKTYIEGFDGWTFTDATLEDDGILVLGETTSYAVSPYYHVDGEKWNYTYDGYTTTASQEYTPRGSVLTEVRYYNELFQKVTANTGYTSNGHARKQSINTWLNSIGWDISPWKSSMLDPNIKNIRIAFRTGSIYSQPISKIRNLKVWGQLPNSFYLIYIFSSDNIGIVETKYAFGKQDINYFSNNGTIITKNQITVTENGIYTFYVRDMAGNETINTIDITKITS